MFLLYNNQLLREQELKLPITDRAFQYNDGFFETAILADGELRFWQQHQQRMQEAAQALQLDVPAYFWEKPFEVQLLKLAQKQDALKCGRLKLKVWRTGAGLYTPQTNAVNWMATVLPVAPAIDQPLHLGISHLVHTALTPLSHFKGPNAPLYVLAALEKQQHDDMLLLSSDGHVAELISSNIFWLQAGQLYTPALETGCVNGIIRRNIIKWCGQNKLQVHEVKAQPEVLDRATLVFAANVTGIRGIASIKEKALPQQEEFLERLRQDLHL